MHRSLGDKSLSLQTSNAFLHCLWAFCAAAWFCVENVSPSLQYLAPCLETYIYIYLQLKPFKTNSSASNLGNCLFLVNYLSANFLFSLTKIPNIWILTILDATFPPSSFLYPYYFNVLFKNLLNFIFKSFCCFSNLSHFSIFFRISHNSKSSFVALWESIS